MSKIKEQIVLLYACTATRNINFNKLEPRSHRHKMKYISDCVNTVKSLYTHDVKGVGHYERTLWMY